VGPDPTAKECNSYTLLHKRSIVGACGGPHDYERSEIPHFLDNRLTDGAEVVRFYESAYNPQEDS
jgi:hypothetical protein